MVKKNPNLVQDCDNERKTPLHWAAFNMSYQMIQILCDFGAPMTVKDDYARRPMDDYVAATQIAGIPANENITKIFDGIEKGEL